MPHPPPLATIRLNARGSPAQAVPSHLLRPEHHAGNLDGAEHRGGRCGAFPYDDALRLLAASDRAVSEQAARALLEVKEGRLHVAQGHSRWGTYLRAFVPKSPRWCQQEVRRARALRDLPVLAAAYAAGDLSRCHLRVLLRVASAQTEAEWLERACGLTVRQLEAVVSQEQPRQGRRTGQDGPAEAVGVDAEAGRFRRRVVMAPPGVAVVVGQAVEVSRKVDGYQIGAGEAVSTMAMETMAGLAEWPDPPEEEDGRGSGGAACGGGGGDAGPVSRDRAGDAVDQRAGQRVHPHPSRRPSPLGDRLDLRRELGEGWEEIHREMEQLTGFWRDLPWGCMKVLLAGAPADDADAHRRVVFWTGLQGRLDAVRGRLLRIIQERHYAGALGFASFGQYVRERMGLSLREAQDLARLDRAVSRLPVAFRMYAAGRLGQRAAWLLTRVATRSTDRAWTRFAMSHTLRLLEAVVEAALLRRAADPAGWNGDGEWPPQDATFAEALRACSHLQAEAGSEPTARIEFLLDEEQEAVYEQALEGIRRVAGRDRPEWFCLAVMARHLIDCYGGEDDLANPERLRRMLHRRVIERDNYTCAAPECLKRGGLEADHMRERSRGGEDTMENLAPLCGEDHRFLKHQARTLALWGQAPDRIMVRAGERVYRNDRIVEPPLREETLDEDPWAAGVEVHDWTREGMREAETAGTGVD